MIRLFSPQPCATRCRRAKTAALLLSLAAPFVAASVHAATPAQEEVLRDFQKTLSLSPGQSLSVEHKFGEVKLHGEPGREVRISATIRAQASSHEEAESFAQKIQIDVQQSSSGIRIKTIYPDEKSWFHISKQSSWSVSYDIAVPVDAAFSVRNAFGSITASGIHGAADLDNSHGSVTIRDSGPTRIGNSFGSIDLFGAAGETSITDNNGSVQATDIKGALHLHNRFGSVTVRNVQGAATIVGGNGTVSVSDTASANISNSFGSVDVRNIRGDVIVRDNNGNVEISYVGGAAEVTDSFANVSLTDIKGRVNCTTSNGRVFATSLSGPSVTIRDSFGNLDLSNISGALNAETSNGKITLRSAHGPVELKSSFGAIEASDLPRGVRAINGNGAINLTDVTGDTFAKTSFGSVSVDRLGGNLTVENSNGSVTARNVKGDATVTTSFAGVTLEGIGGKISVDNQNGGISVAAVRPASGCRDIALKTSFSSIRVRIPEGLGYNLTARTSFGRITSDLPITATGSVGTDSLTGTIGSGGCQLQLTNSNGSIEITKSSQ